LTVKEYLNQACDLDKLIKAKKEQIIRLNDQRMNVSSVLSIAKVQTSRRDDKLAELTSIILDLQDVYAVEVTQLLRLKYDIQILIDSLYNQKQRLVLTEKYVNLKNWEDIMFDNELSWTTMHRYHAAALRALQEKNPDKFSSPDPEN